MSFKNKILVPGKPTRRDLETLFNAAKEGNVKTFKKYAARILNRPINQDGSISSSISSSSSKKSATKVDSTSTVNQVDSSPDHATCTPLTTSVTVGSPHAFDTSNTHQEQQQVQQLQQLQQQHDHPSQPPPPNTTPAHTSLDTVIRYWNDSTRNTALHAACLKNRIRIVKFIHTNQLLNNVNVINRYGKTPLHIACKEGNVQITKYLIEDWKADIEACNNRYQLTPLLYACLHGRLGIIRYLTEIATTTTKSRPQFIPINWNTRDSRGFNILHYATMIGQLDLLKYITKNLSDDVINTLKEDISTDEHGYTMLHTSTLQNGGRLPTIRYCIMELSCNPIRLHDNYGNTILHHLFIFSKMKKYHPKHHLPIIQFLVEKYDDGNKLLQMKNHKEQTAYDVLVEEMDSGEEYDSEGFGNTLSIMRGKKEVLEYMSDQMKRLKEEKYPPRKTNENGSTKKKKKMKIKAKNQKK